MRRSMAFTIILVIIRDRMVADICLWLIPPIESRFDTGIYQNKWRFSISPNELAVRKKWICSKQNMLSKIATKTYNLHKILDKM